MDTGLSPTDPRMHLQLNLPSAAPWFSISGENAGDSLSSKRLKLRQPIGPYATLYPPLSV